MTAGMVLMGLGLLVLALIPLNDSLVLIESGLLAMGCGLGLNVGPTHSFPKVGLCSPLETAALKPTLTSATRPDPSGRIGTVLKNNVALVVEG
jgi:hypothetical protein